MIYAEMRQYSVRCKTLHFRTRIKGKLFSNVQLARHENVPHSRSVGLLLSFEGDIYDTQCDRLLLLSSFCC